MKSNKDDDQEQLHPSLPVRYGRRHCDAGFSQWHVLGDKLQRSSSRIKSSWSSSHPGTRLPPLRQLWRPAPAPRLSGPQLIGEGFVFE